VRCASCGAELMEVGYPIDGFQYYKCPNRCKNIFGLGTKVTDKLKAGVLLIVLFLVFIFTIPALIAKIIGEKYKSIQYYLRRQ